jgi:hypothetical protein
VCIAGSEALIAGAQHYLRTAAALQHQSMWRITVMQAVHHVNIGIAPRVRWAATEHFSKLHSNENEQS